MKQEREREIEERWREKYDPNKHGNYSIDHNEIEVKNSWTEYNEILKKKN